MKDFTSFSMILVRLFIFAVLVFLLIVTRPSVAGSAVNKDVNSQMEVVAM